MRQHLQTAIAQNNPRALKAAWDDLVMNGNQAAIPILKVLDISTEGQQQLMRNLSTKYGPQFSESSEFKKYITDKFKIPAKDCHVVYFGGGHVSIDVLLQKRNRPRSEEKVSDKPQAIFHIHAPAERVSDDVTTESALIP